MRTTVSSPLPAIFSRNRFATSKSHAFDMVPNPVRDQRLCWSRLYFCSSTSLLNSACSSQSRSVKSLTGLSGDLKGTHGRCSASRLKVANVLSLSWILAAWTAMAFSRAMSLVSKSLPCCYATLEGAERLASSGAHLNLRCQLVVPVNLH